jgi:hypothetical protein
MHTKGAFGLNASGSALLSKICRQARESCLVQLAYRGAVARAEKVRASAFPAPCHSQENEKVVVKFKAVT